MEIQNVAIVTGAGRGIGRCIATEFASKNHAVIIAEKDESAGIETEQIIQKKGGIAKFIRTNVSRVPYIENMVQATMKLFGRIDVLVNNAGISKFYPPDEITMDQWDLIIDTNLRGSFFCAREVSKKMKIRGGSIINIASTRALMSEPNSEAYAASKGGLVSLTHALAASLASSQIRVNCISPGWIETGDYSLLRDVDHAQHFVKRVGKPEDIAETCVFLASENSGFITGTSLIIDGGMTRKMIYEL